MGKMMTKVWKRKNTTNKNPLLTDVPVHGQKSEERVIKDMGAMQTIASGSIDGMKSDGVKESLWSECKATVKKSISLKHEWLLKIREEALATGKVPVLTISFVDGSGEAKAGGDFAVIPLYMFMDFAEWLAENESEI